MDNLIMRRNVKRAVITYDIAEYLAQGKSIDCVPTAIRADKDEWTVSALAEAQNKPHKPTDQYKKPFSCRWADTALLARAAQAIGGKAGAAAQRGKKKPR
jgi:hypothetical protein